MALKELIAATRDTPRIDLAAETEWVKGGLSLVSSLGFVRQKENRPEKMNPGQDRVFMAPNRGVFIVDDGMGGEFGGEIAATIYGQIALEDSENVILDPYAFFEDAVRRATGVLQRLRQRCGWEDSPKTCSIGAYVYPTPERYLSGGEDRFRARITLALVGDCQAYKLRPNGEVFPIFRMDRPHVDPALSEFRATRAQGANYVGSCISGDDVENAPFDIRFEDIRLEADELLLLATDGIVDNKDVSIPQGEVMNALSPGNLAHFLANVMPGGLVDPAQFIRAVREEAKIALPEGEAVLNVLKKVLEGAYVQAMKHGYVVGARDHMNLAKLWSTETLSDIVLSSVRNRKIDPEELRIGLAGILAPGTMRKEDDGGFVVIVPERKSR